MEIQRFQVVLLFDLNIVPAPKLTNKKPARKTERLEAPQASKEIKPTAKQAADDIYVHLPLFLPQHLHFSPFLSFFLMVRGKDPT